MYVVVVIVSRRLLLYGGLYWEGKVVPSYLAVPFRRPEWRDRLPFTPLS